MPSLVARSTQRRFSAARIRTISRCWSRAASKPVLRAAAIQRKVLGPDHPLLGTTLNNLGQLEYQRGRYAEAGALYLQALEIWKKALGPEHPALGDILQNMAENHAAQGENAEADRLYQTTLALWRKTPPEFPRLAICLESYARLLRRLKRKQEASEMEAQANALLAQHVREHPEAAQTIDLRDLRATP